MPAAAGHSKRRRYVKTYNSLIASERQQAHERLQQTPLQPRWNIFAMLIPINNSPKPADRS